MPHFWDVELHYSGVLNRAQLGLLHTPYQTPSESKKPNNRVLGLRCYNLNGIWDVTPSFLGPRTVNPKTQAPIFGSLDPKGQVPTAGGMILCTQAHGRADKGFRV